MIINPSSNLLKLEEAMSAAFLFYSSDSDPRVAQIVLEKKT